MKNLLNCVALHREAVHRKLEIEFDIREMDREFGSLRNIDLDALKRHAEEAAEMDLRFRAAAIAVADTHLDMLVAMHADAKAGGDQ